MADFHIVDDTYWHIGIGGIFWVLLYGNAAALFYCDEAGGTVVEHPSQNDAGYPRAMSDGGGAEQGIHGRTVAVFAGAFGD